MDTCTEEEAARKRIKTMGEADELVEENSLDDEELTSHYGIDELYHRLPAHVLEEMFGCFDLCQSIRLSRVSTDWSASLSRQPLRQNGTVVLEKLQRNAHAVLYHVLENHTAGRFTLTQHNVRRLVLIGQFWPCLVADLSLPHRAASYMKTLSGLLKVTFCRDRFKERKNWRSLAEIRQAVPVSLVDCSCELFDCTVRNQTHYFAKVAPMLKFPDASWCFDVTLPSLNIELDSDESMDLLERLVIFVDIEELVWQYPNEQLQWLMRTLDNLDEKTKFVVKQKHSHWQSSSEVRKTYSNKLSSWEAKATLDGRKLLAYDLAFLGRFLVFLNQTEAIDDLQPPPYAFPEDFKTRPCVKLPYPKLTGSNIW